MDNFTIDITRPLWENDTFDLVGSHEAHDLSIQGYAAECPAPSNAGKDLHHLFIQIIDFRNEDEPIVVMTFPSNLAAQGIGDSHGHYTTNEVAMAWKNSREAFIKDAEKNNDDVGAFYRSLYSAGAMLITTQIETARAIEAAQILGIPLDRLDDNRDIRAAVTAGPDLLGGFDLNELFDIEEDDGPST